MKGGTFTFTAVFEPAEEGGFFVSCPALLGCMAQGENMEEARSSIRDSLELYLSERLKMDQTLPDDVDPETKFTKESITVNI